MLFRYSYEIAGLRTHVPEGRGLEFRFDAAKSIVISLARDYSDGQNPLDPSSAICVGEVIEEPTNAGIASDLNAGLAAPLDGTWSLLRDAAPSTVDFLDGIFGELQPLMRQTVGIFRWREGLAEGPHDPCRNPRGSYSRDGRVWLGVPLARSFEMLFGLPTWPGTPANEICDEVVGLVSRGMEEPLGHQLFREAWDQRQTNPRSSLVIGVAAAEVGLKRLIGSLVPGAKWLVDEVQTPSFSMMIRKYLPTLPVKAHFKNKTICPPNQLIKVLEKAVNYRNKLVHAGKAPPPCEDLEEMLRAVNDFLWICDAYEGHPWAGRQISVATLNAWRETQS